MKLILAAALAAGAVALTAPTATAGEWTGDYCTNLPGAQTIDQQGITWKFRAGTSDPTDCKAITVTTLTATRHHRHR